MKQSMAIKDSGEREAFATGSQRDAQIGKPRPSLTPTSTLLKLDLHFGNGASKYEERNWEKGQPLMQYLDSAERHIKWYRLGLTDEPHLVAAMWNLICYDWTLDAIKCGVLPAELDNRPWHMKEDNPMGAMMNDLVAANIETMVQVKKEKEESRYKNIEKKPKL